MPARPTRPDVPNVVQAVVGRARDAGSTVGPGRPARLVEANVDDVTGEVLAHTIAELLGRGAYDAWATPIVMKKGRPAHTVHALCDDGDVRGCVRGDDRRDRHARHPRGRRRALAAATTASDTVEVDGQTIRVKLAAGRVKVEHDDAVAAATSPRRLPLRDVGRRA